MSTRPGAQRREEMVTLYRELGDWRCPLADSRTKLVFGNGNADADLMFVGEAPGAQEDREGTPFVGRAGRLLDQLLSEIGLARQDVFVTNVLQCRPPGNRDPLPEEIEECEPHLLRKIALIEPKVICTLGNFATKLLTGSPQGITKVHGRPQPRRVGDLSVQLYPIYHPAAALRTQTMLEGLREDLSRLPALLDQARGPHTEAPPMPVPAEPDASQLGLFGDRA